MTLSDQVRQDDPRETTFRESVVVYLPNKTEADTTVLAAALAEVCTRTKLGIFAGTEQEGAEAALYFASPDAHTLLTALEPILFANEDAANNARIILATGFGATRTYNDFPLQLPVTLSEYSTNEWRGYRAIKSRLIILILGWIPVGLLSAIISNLFFRSETPAFVVISVYAAAIAYTYWRLLSYKCPICGKFLQRNFLWLAHFYRSACRSCGTPINPKYSPR